jgi:hypothetical protein
MSSMLRRSLLFGAIALTLISFWNIPRSVCIEEEKVQDARSTLLYHRQHLSGHVTMQLQFL